jgi:mono/diheme cytochrome c family protein
MPWPVRTTTIVAALCVQASLAGIFAKADPAASVETGKMIYTDYCATCHGYELRNTTSGQIFDLRRLRAEDHARFVNSVLNGKNSMPPWRGMLETDQIESIWAYIRATVDQ